MKNFYYMRFYYLFVLLLIIGFLLVYSFNHINPWLSIASILVYLGIFYSVFAKKFFK